jgi:tetratricopeptide (TPR) repeat protein
MQLVSSGRPADAVPVGKEALDVAKKTFGTEHANYGLSLNNLAWAYSLSGSYSEAEQLFKKSISNLEKLQIPELALPLSNLASMYATQRRFVEAESVSSRSLEVISKSYGPDSTNTAAAESVLALIYTNGGKPAEAERLYKLALEIYEKNLPPDHVELGRTYGNLGYLYETEGKRAEAEDLYRRALAIFEKTLSPQDPLIVTTQQYIARVSGGSTSGSSEAALFQQCMNEKIQACMYDCTVNYRFKESKCRNELCSITGSKGGDNNRLWTSYCQRKVKRQLRDQQ